jgi:hypothetical protein
MTFNIQNIENWEYIKQRKQQIMNLYNIIENPKRKEYVYKIGGKVLSSRVKNKYETHI